jgi:O-antigen ligase
MDNNKIKRFFINIFSLTSCLSVAINNVGLVIAGILSFNDRNNIKYIYDEYRDIINAFCVFWVCLLPSIIFSGNLVESFKDFGSVYIYRFLPFFIALCIINNRQIEFNNDIIIFSAFIASSVAIYQGIFLDIKRVIGLSNHPMVFAGLLCIVIPMSFINFFNENFSKLKRSIYFLSFCFFSFALLLNATRGAWIAMAIVIAIVLFVAKNSMRKMIALLAIFLLLCISFFNSGYFENRVLSIKSMQANSERLLIWESSKKMFLDNPITGVGLGNYTYQYQNKYISPQAKEPYLRNSHNIYLQFLAENGVIGFIGFLYLFYKIITVSISAFRKKQNMHALIGLGITFGFLIHGLTECTFSNTNVVKLYWFVLGGCFAIVKNKPLEITKEK